MRKMQKSEARRKEVFVIALQESFCLGIGIRIISGTVIGRGDFICYMIL